MATLTTTQIQHIREHMIEDEKELLRKYKARKGEYDYRSVFLNEVEDLQKEGWEQVAVLKKKANMQKRKECGRLFEDEMWCMFYELGFRILNADDKLEPQWGPNPGDHHQLDIVAVSDSAIFVVECKAADEEDKPPHFHSDIDTMCRYKDGMAESLRQVYGQEKRVKFLFATKNYCFPPTCQDGKRLSDNGIYLFQENTYNYVCNLITAYKGGVEYQFYGLMFKNEIIDDTPINIPALKGKMGNHEYYMLSITPEVLLKIGFVLHRTKVNDSMAPTYQRLLIPKRLAGISKFINDGGYFPNSIIINFDTDVKFTSVGNSDELSNFGILTIPNAYGIAYIIDGQHRVYGYATTNHKKDNTIPVVAFANMESAEQLRIFMDINENQKAVKPSLRLDLIEDINWDSNRVNSRIAALRSAIIKYLTRSRSSALFNKISVGEDNSLLTFTPFDNALKKASFLPKATQTAYNGNLEYCLYDTNNLNHNQAMNDAKSRIGDLISSAYFYVKGKLEESIYKRFVLSNRGTFGFIVLLSSIHEHLINNNELTKKSSSTDQLSAMKPYLDMFVNYITNIPQDESDHLILYRGQGAESEWLHTFENAIQKQCPEFIPEGLKEWQESKDVNIQESGKSLGRQIIKIVHERVLDKVKELFGAKWEDSLTEIRLVCLQRAAAKHQDEETGFNMVGFDWTEELEAADYKKIIEKFWQYPKTDDPDYKTFESEFTIKLTDKCTSKKDKLKWLSDLISMSPAWTSVKGKGLTKDQVNSLDIILQQLQPE